MNTKKNLFEMSDAEYEVWLAQNGMKQFDVTIPSEENLIALVSHALRSTNPKEKAKLFSELAIMCLAMSDITLGAKTTSPQGVSLNLNSH